MGRLIDADELDITTVTTDDYSGNEVLDVVLKDDIDEAPTIEAIPKADYENRLKADLVAMLEEIQLEIEESEPLCNECDYAIDDCTSRAKVNNIIQQEINKLKGGQ